MRLVIHEASSIEIFPLGNGVLSDINKALAALLQPLETLLAIIGRLTKIQEKEKVYEFQFEQSMRFCHIFTN